jgi:hypothetical protein
MRLNLPTLDELAACENLLIAGMGGGFDLFCGLPVYFELRRLGRRVHLANLSFTALEHVKDAERLSDFVTGVRSDSRSVLLYCPELHLAHWLGRERGDVDATVWCLHSERGGALPVTAGFRALRDRLNLDGVLLIDGGIDSLSRGDEAEAGTILEDSYSLAAVNALIDIPLRLLACLGMGAEREVTHAHLLENVAALTAAGAFRGACALTPEMESFREYERAVEYVHSRRGQDPSVINASVVSAVRGHFGDYHATEKTRRSRLWINPLMTLYWVFDLPAVAARNLYLPELANSASRLEALAALLRVRERVGVRSTPTAIPLP